MKKKLLTLISALSLVSVVGIATSVSATGLGLELDYNEEASTSDKKVVDVYYTGPTSLTALNITFEVGCEYTDATYAVSGGIGKTEWNPAQLSLGWIDDSYMGIAFDKGLHGQLTLTVPENVGAFEVSVSALEAMDDMYSMYMIADGSATLPESLTIGAVVEDEEVTIDATPAGFYTYWQNDTAAAAFTANLTAEQAAKTVTWTVTNGEKTKTEDTTVDTSVSGDGDVVIGLVVSNAVEGLTATVTVK